MRFPFQFTEELFPGLCQPQLLVFCATLALGFLGFSAVRLRGQHVGPPTDDWKWAPISLASTLRSRWSGGAIVPSGSGRCEGLSWSLSSSPPSSSSSLPPSGSSWKPRRCAAPAVRGRCLTNNLISTGVIARLARSMCDSRRPALCGMDSWSLGFSPWFPAPVTSGHPVRKKKSQV